MKLILFVSLLSLLIPSENIINCLNKEEPFIDDGPMFYSASYSTDFTAEPNYQTQNNYTFSTLNLGDIYEDYRGDSVKVAIIDSGLNYTHEDFVIDNQPIIQSHSRTIDNTSGQWLYYQHDKYPNKIIDTLGHGTNVAACVASAINGIGGAGIAPNVDLYVYKVTNTNNGYEWYAIQSALQYCIDEGIDIINMSFQAYEHAVSYGSSSMPASTGCSTVLTNYIDACYNAGIVMVAASGNFNTTEPSYPANNNHVISVGSLAESSLTTKAGYSNYGHNDLVAPGTVYVADKDNNSDYTKTQGTSFSSPIVTGAIALYKQKYPTATVDEIIEALFDSCDYISGADSWQGHGRLNIEAFLDPNYIPVTSVSFTNIDETTELHVGDSMQLEWEVLPENATNKDVSFISMSDCVSISEDGYLTVLKEGEEMIGVYSNENDKIDDYIELTILPPKEIPATSIVLDKTSLTLKKGESYTLIPTITPNNTTETLSFSSNNTSVATVNGDGAINAISRGKATITATIGNVEASCEVTVTDIKAIKLNGPETYKLKDDFIKSNYTVKAIYDDNSEVDVTSNATIGNIDTTILGNQTLTATYNSFVDEIIIKVTNNGASDEVGIDKEDIIEDHNVSYTFTNKSWGSNPSNGWTNGKDGEGYANNGVQVTTGASGANATSVNSYTNISKVVVSYCTNASRGAGSISIKIGNNSEVSQNITKTGGITARNLTYNFSPSQTGTIKISVTCSQNSIYIKGITITYQTIIPGENYKISPEEQAIAWAKYFNSFASIYCDATGNNSDISGLSSIWNEVKNEYNYMNDLSKSALLDSDNSDAIKALTTYQIIITKYQSFDNFIVDKNGNPLYLNKNLDTSNVSNTVLVVFAFASIIGFTLLLILKKRRFISK